MHKTLKAATARPPQAHLAAKQRCFDHFRERYNTERPHEALGDETPASRYTPSPRPYRSRLAPLLYPGMMSGGSSVATVGSAGMRAG